MSSVRGNNTSENMAKVMYPIQEKKRSNMTRNANGTASAGEIKKKTGIAELLTSRLMHNNNKGKSRNTFKEKAFASTMSTTREGCRIDSNSKTY